MKTVIMAGGKGTRMATLHDNIPKPMIKLCGKPIIEHQIERFKSYGFNEFIIVTGYLGEQIVDYFGDGSDFDVSIQYYNEKQPLGTAGALFRLKEQLTEDFFLINGDLLFDVKLPAFLQFHFRSNGFATILTHSNDHPYDSGIIQSNQDDLVLKWLHSEENRLWYKNQINAGIHILSPSALRIKRVSDVMNLDRDVLTPLISQKKLYSYQTTEYVYDLGTPERLSAAIHDIETGMLSKKSLANKQRAIFLDRDGVINREKGIIHNIDDFELLDDVPQAIRMMNKSGYLVIVTTNQPVIARGELDFEGLTEIHNKMETLLGKEGAYVDDIFFCPHHPHRGYDGERIEYKIECDCRKPKPGMLLEAARKYNINLSDSWMVGDHMRDIEAGRNAGCQTAFIGEAKAGMESFQSLLHFSKSKICL